MSLNSPAVNALVQSAKVLIVEDEAYSRKVIRSLLMTIGVRKVWEANDGKSGLTAICNVAPDIVLLDWDMPVLDGAQFMRQVRSPTTFPMPAVPVIMVTGYGERSRVVEAVRLGVHEYLLKPVSTQALLSRMTAVLANPRPMVRRGDYYGPEPRKMWTYKPEEPRDIVLLD